MTDLTGARITSLRTEGSRRPYAAQPQTVTHASSMEAARAALMGRMRRAGHTPQLMVTGPSGTSYACTRCFDGWSVNYQGSGEGWNIDAIPICTSAPPPAPTHGDHR
jgi:hypothetical protein